MTALQYHYGPQMYLISISQEIRWFHYLPSCEIPSWKRLNLSCQVWQVHQVCQILCIKAACVLSERERWVGNALCECFQLNLGSLAKTSSARMTSCAVHNSLFFRLSAWESIYTLCSDPQCWNRVRKNLRRGFAKICASTSDKKICVKYFLFLFWF